MKNEATLDQIQPGNLYSMSEPKRKQSSFQQGGYKQLLRSPHKEPESARPFLPGDPVSFIDWKAYAKTDQLMMREITPKAQANVTLTLDGSESMHWPGKDLLPDAITKAELMSRVAFFLGYALLREGNNLLLEGLRSDSNEYKRIANSRDLLASYALQQTNNWNFKGQKSKPKAFANRRGQDTRLVFSDGIHLHPKDLEPFKGRTLFFHVLSKFELQREWMADKTCYYEGLAGTKEYMGKDLKSDQCHTVLNNWMANFKKKLTDPPHNFGYLLITDETPISSFLFLLQQLLNPKKTL